MKNRIAAFILMLALTVSTFIAVPLYASASNAEKVSVSFNSPSNGDEIKSQFRYAVSSMNTGLGYSYDNYAIYFYSDSYFTEPSTVFNSHLATMSFVYSMASFTKINGSSLNCYSRAEELLTNVGFSDFETNAETDYEATPETIGVVMAKKTILDEGKPYTLVAIALRGGGYGSEWAGNFLVGSADETNGDHKGFYQARDRALTFIKDYISENVEGDVKLWITGFSRGGAVGGLVGAWFDDNLDNQGELGISLSHEDVFTYTVEAPTSTHKKNLEGKNYTNIFNIVNDADLVPRVPFSESEETGWNFERPGVYMPMANLSGQDAERVNEILRSLNPHLTYDIHNFSSIFPALGRTQSKFLDNFISNLALKVDRQTYVDKIQGPLTEIIGNITNRSDEELVILGTDILEGICLSLGISADMDVSGITKFINSLAADDSASDSVVSAIGNNLLRVGVISEYNEDVRVCLTTLIDAFFRNKIGETNLALFVANILTNTVTRKFDGGYELTENRILSAHNPETVLALFMFSDSYYSEEPTGFVSSASDKQMVSVTVKVGDESFTSYYYKGDSVKITASASGCLAVGGWYLENEELSDSSVCSFDAKDDVTLTLTTEPNHRSVTAWITETKPTANSEGLKYKVCGICGTRVDTMTVPKLDPSDLEAPTVTDGSEILPLVMIPIASVVLVSAVSVALIAVLRKRRPKDHEQ